MAALDQGPASGNGVLTFATNAPGLEVHVGAANPNNALNPLGPAYAPFVDPNGPITFTPVNKALVINGGLIQFSSPA
jgi:hypothetical protein